jgi:uncharacterized protein YeaO (DUF488 family)
VLVDRMWPRGKLSREKIEVAEWMKDVGPSKDLIKWFGHDPKKWEEFPVEVPEGACEEERFARNLGRLGGTDL